MPLNTITLDQDEQYVIQLLNDVARKMSPDVKVYIAGGWVRDRLLGKPSHDIDAMVYNTTGPLFAKAVADHLGMKDPHVIRANPEKSKSMETARLYLPLPSGETIDIDFAMARQETYNENSRIPDNVKAATPQEDAVRRDLTVNSLFYDVSNGTIEDFTGHGLEDLQKGVLRAPGTPFVRFMEDPLRILRVIRFAARYGWTIEPQTYAAMTDPRVLDILRQKTSKERLGEEFIKIMGSPHADLGYQLLRDTGILEGVKNDAIRGTKYEGKMSPWTMSQNNAHHKLTLDEHTLQVLRNALKLYSNESPEKRLIAILTALFHDVGKMFHGIQGTTPYGSTSFHGHEDESVKLTEFILKHLRLDHYIPKVAPLVLHHMRPHALVESTGPKAIRKLLRDLADDGAHWIDLLNQAEADALAKNYEPGPEEQEYLRKLQMLRDQVKAIEAEMATKAQPINKPILNGFEIMDIFGRANRDFHGVPPDWIKQIQTWLLDVQDGNPNITREEARQRIYEQFPQFIKTNKTAVISSDILIDKRREQIDAVISQKPVEAMTLAVALWKEYPEDERTLLLCLNTAIRSKILTGKNVGNEEIYQAGQKLAKDRFFNPEIIGSFFGYKTIMGKNLTSEDEVELKRAAQMDLGIITQIARAIQSSFSSENAPIWQGALQYANHTIVKS